VVRLHTACARGRRAAPAGPADVSSWLDDLALLDRAMAACADERDVVAVSYESLVADPERVACTIFDWLAVDAGSPDFRRAKRRGIAPSPRVTAPPDPVLTEWARAKLHAVTDFELLV